jgi:glycosyltransferase involved in cell wall biosynthesis
MKISSCLIVKNEAENIERCLNSIKDISNEIIVVDTGSTDNTKEIALKFGAKIYDFTWDNNFSNAKNYALDQATGDWIIFLDADEYFESNTKKILGRVFEHIHNNKAIDGVLCKMINTEGLNGKIISENPTVRIFRGKCGIRFSGAVHEQLLKNNKPFSAANITDYSLLIYHTGYSSVLLPEKIKRNLKILEGQIAKNEITNLTYYYMSSMHNNLDNYEESIKYALLALKEPTIKDTIMAYQPYVLLIKSMFALKDKYKADEIEKYANEAIEAFPTHPEVWYVRALVKKMQQDYHAAIDSFLRAIEYNKNFNLLLNNNFPGQLQGVYYSLAETYKLAGDPIHALEYYFEALKIDKHNIDAVAGLYDLIKNQDSAEIILFLNSIYDKESKEDLVFLNAAMAKLGNTVLANYYYKLHEES